jgi:hypothetical protein
MTASVCTVVRLQKSYSCSVSSILMQHLRYVTKHSVRTGSSSLVVHRVFVVVGAAVLEHERYIIIELLSAAIAAHGACTWWHISIAHRMRSSGIQPYA